MVEPFKEGLTKPVKDGGWGIKKFNLDDLYVRFFRIAERRIVKSGMGVVSYISNFSYLGDPSFVVMRQRFLDEFDKLWFDCMNGDSRETGKKTPDGEPDPSVFSTEQSRVGIRVGTAISLMVRKKRRSKKPMVRFRHFWGVNKRRELLDSLIRKRSAAQYEVCSPSAISRLSIRPRSSPFEYATWPAVAEIAKERPFPAFMESRRGSLISIDHDVLENRMGLYYDKSLPWDQLKELAQGITIDTGRYDALKTRRKVLDTEVYEADNLRRYLIRPFDLRWCYYSQVRPLWNETRPALWQQVRKSNTCIATRLKTEKIAKGSPLFPTSNMCDCQSLARNVSVIPVSLYPLPTESGSLELSPVSQEPVETTANLSSISRAYLKTLGLKNPDKDVHTAEMIWMHALAIGYSPAYLTENADGIRQDWPRIPLPDSKKVLLDSAKLGNLVAALLDTERGVSGVTSGRLRTELKTMGIVSRVGGGSLTAEKGDFDLTAGWGHAGKDGVTMPGKGRIEERTYTGKELEAFEVGAKALGLTSEQVLKHLGKNTRDIYLNDIAYWKNIPGNVWDYHIGGYQVIKKWLSYREKGLLGRSMKMEEVEYVTEMTRRIAAILLLEPSLDENYLAVKASTYPWSNT